jgi:hypothetical protein
VDLTKLSRSRLQAMAAAGREVALCHEVLARTGDNIVGELLRHQGTFYEWNHYPAGDVYDRQTHAQYYYHAHPQTQRSGEHGHFHTFLRGNGMPERVGPVPLPDLVVPENRNDILCHLIAISMDRHGLPIRLFTTNRWVTGETWFAAADVRSLLARFEIGHAQPSWPANRWVGAMIRLFRPQIEALVDERDRRITAWTDEHRPDNVYEDRALEITSMLDISVEAQVAAVADALEAKRAKAR